MQHSDQKYINALLENDATVLEELYQRFSEKIKWMIIRNNGSETDAADIFQDALLSIYNKAKGGDFTLTCPFEAFLYLICKNKWLNILSKRKTQKVTITDTEGFNYIGEDDFKLAEDCVLRQERNNLLAEKLAEMGDSCKKILQLSWSGIAMDEVAKQLNVTYAYARKKKSECVARLISLVKQSPKFNSLKW
ncbi:sigma-70 family RNA polymerase sigma factor [Agriterribacter sp.]|uniref:RNA polymerase sigma factor n=1 Tax=Agriterribacter sp. TaxID=2821509 RepID=UPI002CC46BDF|nr:sigma-70 family RNA polymerase sigma factor [Agriterribacter sp.]HRP55937.1 sigma-70 family RNA polymerase sigma factor [Agriterribacter sp.]